MCRYIIYCPFPPSPSSCSCSCSCSSKTVCDSTGFSQTDKGIWQRKRGTPCPPQNALRPPLSLSLGCIAEDQALGHPSFPPSSSSRCCCWFSTAHDGYGAFGRILISPPPPPAAALFSVSFCSFYPLYLLLFLIRVLFYSFTISHDQYILYQFLPFLASFSLFCIKGMV